MGRRRTEFAYFMLASLLDASTALTLLYLTGLITTIGTSNEIPFILGGFIIGSAFFPLVGYSFFRSSRKMSAAAGAVVPIAFLAVYSIVEHSRLVGNYEMLFLSFLVVAGDMFIAPVFSLREGTGAASAIGIGLGGLFVMTIMLIVYAALFDSHMPLIILSADSLAIIMLITILASQEWRAAIAR